ncbi:FimV/HubP family polar landmark protein [uncultured Pseudacidovorax sp.]|uniref:FimV/HubP family polar landmark protein n=1 Tax=uncultured Pseudacidovorax sp. TaxID=679313 RepID=UPI0025E5FE4E|nr:FimV/HubP family polar landmark protein [uncultured Pseudacidovorax sp.]
MTRLSPPAQAAGRDTAASAAVRRFRISALGLAMVTAFGLWSAQAQALTLGSLNVLSALGEPLRAEVQITDVTQTEATNLQVRLATPQAFQNSGLTFADALEGVRTTLQRRADGRYVVRLDGIRPVNDPFVDILIEANSPTGRLVRDYTALIDPPPTRLPTAPAGVSIDRPITPPPPRVQARPERPRTAPVEVAPSSAPAQATGPSGTVTVRAGETAGRIAAANKPADVSLDQMLLAMLRANPSAFTNGNVNRLRAGAVLQMPSADTARATPADEARRTIVAQSRDFNSYRQRLATNAPSMNVEGADRQASGGLQARVQDRAAAASSADRLTISRGSASGAVTSEERLAQQRQAQESSSRVAELSRNIEELNRLQGASGNTPTGATVPAATVPAGAASSPAAAPSAGTANSTASANTAGPAAALPMPPASSPAAPSPTPQAAASAVPPPPAVVAPPAASASAPAPSARPAPAPTPKQEEPSFLDSLLANPLALAGGGVVLLLLLLALLARQRRHQKKDAAESLFPESLQKDSYFGGSGGATVDTKEDHSGASSLNYSPSQLDAGDVDPVAEADVYLAYGRDLQAEEILKEALRTSPERTSIQLKLLEIYARRRDARAFEQLAHELQAQTGGKGADWHRAQELGRGLDAANTLYQGPHTPPSSDLSGDAAAPAGLGPTATGAGLPAAPSGAGAATGSADEPRPQAFVPSVAPLDFDLDLDLPPARPAPAPQPASPRAPSISSLFPSALAEDPPPAAPAFAAPGAGAGLRGTADEPTIPAPLRPAPAADLGNDFDTAPAELEPMGGFRHGGEEVRTQPATLHAPLEGSDIFSRDFHAALNTADTQPMDLQLNIPTGIDGGQGESAEAVKLSLARELHALGDPDGARTLLEELIAEGNGAVQEEARRLLDELR